MASHAQDCRSLAALSIRRPSLCARDRCAGTDAIRAHVRMRRPVLFATFVFALALEVVPALAQRRGGHGGFAGPRRFWRARRRRSFVRWHARRIELS